MARFTSTFIKKEEIAPQTYIVVFKTNSDSSFDPGQFATIEVAEKQRRSYSYVDICKTSPNYISEPLVDLTNTDEYYHIFLISTKAGGAASQTFENLASPQEFNFLSPLGKFKLETINTKAPKNFVCTGTGLAPFVPMIKAIKQNNPDVLVRLFFGTSADVGDYARRFFKDLEADENFELYTGMFPEKISNPSKFVQNGTVTEILPSVVTNLADEEYYLCGNPYMVADVKDMLEKAGCTNIFSESYGAVVKK